MIKWFLIISLLLVCKCYLEANKYYSVVERDSQFQIIEGKKLDGALAWGIYLNESAVDGWGKLTLRTNDFQSIQVAKAAGYLEGALTSKDILASFLKGLVNGYNSVSSDNISYMDFLIIQVLGDINDLKAAVDVEERPDWSVWSSKQFKKHFLKSTHCSVLIKIKDDQSDVFMGHNTWADAEQMLRIYKFYKFGDDFDVQFSGYPGLIYSNDDYYVLNKDNQKLFVTETTNEVLDNSLYDLIHPDSLFVWTRTLVANHLAQNGKEWTEIFIKHNSGTYNNQFMVLDAKRYNSQTGPQEGFLWIIEQMPGYFISQDVTELLVRQGYWASYNVPFFQDIYRYSGYQKAYDQFGDDYSYDRCPRANILRREHENVQSISELRKLMRQKRLNQYQTDPLSLGDPTNVIAARPDLYEDAEDYSLELAIDAKITSLNRVLYQNGFRITKLLQVDYGPTYDDQPVFIWSEVKDPDFSHIGHPDVWRFPWISIQAQE